MDNFSQKITNEDGLIIPKAIAQQLDVSIQELSKITGLNENSLTVDSLSQSDVIQKKLQEITSVFIRAIPLNGSIKDAYKWYFSESLPSLGNLTPRELINQGEINTVIQYLDRMNEGGFT